MPKTWARQRKGVKSAETCHLAGQLACQGPSTSTLLPSSLLDGPGADERLCSLKKLVSSAATPHPRKTRKQRMANKTVCLRVRPGYLWRPHRSDTRLAASLVQKKQI